MSEINTRIATVIKSSGMTKTAFAKKLGISQPFVSQLANGDSVPGSRTISDICREFGVNETWLRTGEGEMFARKDPDQELMDFIAEITSGDDEFRYWFIRTLAKLPPEAWEGMNKALDTFLSEWQERTKK